MINDEVHINRIQTFIEKFYPSITMNDWNDWKWQLKNKIRSFEQLKRFINLSDGEMGFENIRFPVGITPYYMSLINLDDSNHSLRKTVIPTRMETIRSSDEKLDPLNEEGQSPAPRLVHRYPDRVLLLASNNCAANCRYCTRSRMIDKYKFPLDMIIEGAIKYIADNKNVRDVLISGGDPLTLPDQTLENIISKVRSISHVEVIRIGTKIPVVLPQRINERLVGMLKKYHPLWMSIHFTHPDECTPDVYRSTRLLADAGIPLGSQTVLLKDINDNVDTLKSLFHNLMMMRVRPYYLYQCDPIIGSKHFRTTIQKGLDIIKGLQGHTSGYAIPHYIIDIPGGGGKVPVCPNYIDDITDDNIILHNYMNEQYFYP